MCDFIIFAFCGEKIYHIFGIKDHIFGKKDHIFRKKDYLLKNITSLDKYVFLILLTLFKMHDVIFN